MQRQNNADVLWLRVPTSYVSSECGGIYVRVPAAWLVAQIKQDRPVLRYAPEAVTLRVN